MSPRIGILGGGQLGLMLCRAARRLGLETVVATPEADAPALGAAHGAVVGRFDDPRVAAALLARTDVVTFEIESIPEVLLARLDTAEREGRISVRPGTGVLRTLQDKGAQKSWMVRNAIPTLPFRILPAEPELAREAVGSGRGALELPIVQKTRRDGYDGRGVQVLRTRDDLARLWPVPSLIEPCLDARTEVAVVVARGTDGSMRCYAPVRMTFDTRRNVLDMVESPAGLPRDVARDAKSIARRAVAALGGVGVFAVEMFVTSEDTVLVNEISPRVHNAGHHTIESCTVSQFEQHLRAVAGLPLGSTRGERPALMRNLLYTDRLAGLHGAPAGTIPTAVDGTFVHWYGKREPRPWRKMGHLTCVAPDAGAARRGADAALEALTSGCAGQAA